MHPVSSTIFQKLCPALQHVEGNDLNVVFHASRHVYSVLTPTQYRASQFDPGVSNGDWHDVKTCDLVGLYVDLDGCGPLGSSQLNSLLFAIIELLHEYDTSAYLMMCDMTQDTPSYHLTARGDKLVAMPNRVIAALVALAMSKAFPRPQETLRKAGIVVDFAPYNRHNSQMRAVGSTRSSGQGNKIPTHNVKITDGVCTLHPIEDSFTNRELASAFYGKKYSEPDERSDEWLATLLSRAYSSDVDPELRKLIPTAQHASIARFLKSRRSVTDGSPPPAAQRRKLDTCHSSAASCLSIDALLAMVPLLRRVTERCVSTDAQKYTGAQDHYSFSVSKSTFSFTMMPNGQVSLHSVSLFGSKSFPICPIRTLACNQVCNHSTPRVPLVKFDLRNMMCVWVCPWSSSHAGSTNKKFGLSEVEVASVLSYVSNVRNISPDIVPVQLTTRLGVADYTHSTLQPFRTTVEFLSAHSPVDITHSDKHGHALQNGILDVKLFKHRCISLRDKEFVLMKIDIADSIDRKLLKIAHCPRFGIATNVVVSGFEDSVLAWKLFKHLLDDQPCVAVWLPDKITSEMLHATCLVSTTLGLLPLCVMPTDTCPVVATSVDDIMHDKGRVVCLKLAYDAYDTMHPIYAELYKHGQLRLSYVHSPDALSHYIEWVRRELPKKKILLLSPWENAEYVNAKRVCTVSVMRTDAKLSDSLHSVLARISNYVVVIWDTHLMPSTVLGPLLHALAMAVASADFNKSAVPFMNILCAYHTYTMADGASLLQHMLTRIPSRIYECPLHETQQTHLPSLNRSSSLDMVNMLHATNSKFNMDSVFKSLKSSPHEALDTLHEHGIVEIMDMRSMAPDVLGMCTSTLEDPDLVKYVIPSLPGTDFPHLANFKHADKMDVLQMCSMDTSACVVIIALVPSPKRSSHLIRLLWMVMQYTFKRVVVLTVPNCTYYSNLEEPVKYGRIVW